MKQAVSGWFLSFVFKMGVVLDGSTMLIPTSGYSEGSLNNIDLMGTKRVGDLPKVDGYLYNFHR